MQISWSTKAKSSYSSIRLQIRNRFSTAEEREFVQSVFQTIKTIQSFPKAYPLSKRAGLKGVRRAVLHPHCSLFYILESKSKIRILFFLDNRSDPKPLGNGN